MATNVHRYFRCMGNPSHSAGLTVREVNLLCRFACVVLILYLLQNPLSMKSSVAPESIIALIVTCLFVLCSRIWTIICSFSLSNVSVLFSAAYRFLISMGFGLVLSLRPLLTGDFCRFPTLLLLLFRPPFLVLWLIATLASCCQFFVPKLLLPYCLFGFGMPRLCVLVCHI